MTTPGNVSGSVGQPPYKQYFGIYAGSIANANDPLQKGRCQLQVPQVLGTALSNWADRMSLPLATGVPQAGQPVLVMFTGGDINRPCYFAGAWEANIYPQLSNLTVTGGGSSPAFFGPPGVTFGGVFGDHTQIDGGNIWQYAFPFSQVTIIASNNQTQGVVGPYVDIVAPLQGFGAGAQMRLYGDKSDGSVAGSINMWRQITNDSTVHPINLNICGTIGTVAAGGSAPGTPETWHTVNSGFPAGWSGNLNYRLLAEAGGLVMINWALSIASTTVVTNAETVLTLPSGYYNSGLAKVFPANAAGTPLTGNIYAPAYLNTSGVFQFQGAGFTAGAGGVLWFGQAIFTTAV